MAKEKIPDAAASCNGRLEGAYADAKTEVIEGIIATALADGGASP